MTNIMSSAVAAEERRERRPLLGPERSSNKADVHRRRAIAACFAMAILIHCAALFSHAPQTSILEGIICTRHYGYGSLPREHDVPWSLSRLSLPPSTKCSTPSTACRGFIVAMPFGTMADCFGRRPVLLLHILGALLQDAICKTILWRPDIFRPHLL